MRSSSSRPEVVASPCGDPPPGPPEPARRSELARLVADDEARYREVNEAAVDLLGYPRERLLQMRVWDITPAAQREAARQAWGQFIAASHQAGEYQVQTADGQIVTVRFQAIANFRPGRHLSLLRPLTRARNASRPLDECPYDRPFPPGFDLCPQYAEQMSERFVLHSREGAPVRTCTHLRAAQQGQAGAFYGRCELGDAITRSGHDREATAV